MPSKIFSACSVGLDCHLIEVEADISSSTPNFFIVGLPDAAVSEAKERVKSAIKNSNMQFPRTKITVNLAPADLKKIGPVFDLPIAIAILNCRHFAAPGKKNYLQLLPEDEHALFIGELSLNGGLRPVNGVLSIASNLKAKGLKRLYLPAENAAEAALVNSYETDKTRQGFLQSPASVNADKNKNLEIYPVQNLQQLIEHLRGKNKIKRYEAPALSGQKTNDDFDFNLGQIKGQYQAKRALVITAAGYHNLLMSGPPGSGKTLLARSLGFLLPPLAFQESMEVTKIYSLAGLLKKGEPLITRRPFRSPHHTASGIALIGGNSVPKPGEITLAHRGILFLDELPQFPRSVLENLRQPLEDGSVTVARASHTITFPCRFTLVAAMNPCACGYLGDSEKPCVCTAGAVQTYQKKISGPILDRIDLKVVVPRLKDNELTGQTKPEDMNKIRQSIIIAQETQKYRLQKFGLLYNAEMDYRLVEQLCRLEPSAQTMLKEAITRFNLSARGFHKVLKVARTISDMAESGIIKTEHLAESLQYR